jgi:capsid protein
MTTRRKRGQVADPAARYDAAGSGRRMAGWNPPATGPNRAIAGLSKIRDRSRDSVRNDWAGESSVGHWVTNLVGVGITPRWESEEHTRIWTENIVPSADADGVLDVYGLQTLGTRAWISDGECFLRRRDRPLDGELVVPVQFQLLESDYCPVFDADSWPNLPVNHVIRQGIELDRRGRRRDGRASEKTVRLFAAKQIFRQQSASKPPPPTTAPFERTRESTGFESRWPPQCRRWRVLL